MPCVLDGTGVMWNGPSSGLHRLGGTVRSE
jgi:hypothetical protein